MEKLCRSRIRPYLWMCAAILTIASMSLGAQVAPPGTPSGPSWPQWALNPQHTLFDSGVAGQQLNQNAVILQYDFNIAAEKADPNAAPGDLLVHYQVPLVDGNDVYIASKD